MGAKASIFRAYKHGAKRRGLDFSLSEGVFLRLIKADCYYCGTGLSSKKEYRGFEFMYNGIDRMDNSKGYNDDNCVTSCVTCNLMKRNLRFEEFIEAVKLIAERF